MKNRTIIKLLLFFILFISSCQTVKVNDSNNDSIDFKLEKDDILGDLSYSYWKPATQSVVNVERQESRFLDLKKCSIESSLNKIVIFIKTDSDINEYKVEENATIEWGIFIDEDRNLLSGKVFPPVTNDIGAEYKITLMKNRDTTEFTFIKLSNNRSLPIEGVIEPDGIKFVISRENIKTANFNFVVFSIKTYFNKNIKLTQSVDTIPNTGNYNSLDNLTIDNDFPLKVTKYLSRNFNILVRPSSPFSIPIETLLEEKYGDCDEYALSAMYLLEKHGIDAYLLQVDFDKWWPEYNTFKRHDICIYKTKNQTWNYIDIYDIGYGIGKKEYQSIEEICDKLPSHYQAHDWILYNVYNHTGKKIKSVEKN